MDSYCFLSLYYDRFTEDVGYSQWVDFFEKIFAQENLSPHLILDLACGTGSISVELAHRGFEVIGVDASSDMLMQAMNRALGLEPQPIFLNQRMEYLDLYGTVDACLCCLDSINYVTDPILLREAFRRVELFLEPGGIFIFDVNTKQKFQSMNGECYIREDDDIFCVWQVEFDGVLCKYDFDIFSQKGCYWDRYQEQHIERYYSLDNLRYLLEDVGFVQIQVYPELGLSTFHNLELENRIFISARKRK